MTLVETWRNRSPQQNQQNPFDMERRDMSRPSEGPVGSAVPGIRDQRDFKKRSSMVPLVCKLETRYLDLSRWLGLSRLQNNTFNPKVC
jgi:hypothetical protein